MHRYCHILATGADGPARLFFPRPGCPAPEPIPQTRERAFPHRECGGQLDFGPARSRHPYVATLAMHRFLKQEKLPSHTLIEPAQDAATRRTSATNSARPCLSMPGTAAPRVRCPDRSRDRDHPAGVAQLRPHGLGGASRPVHRAGLLRPHDVVERASHRLRPDAGRIHRGQHQTGLRAEVGAVFSCEPRTKRSERECVLVFQSLNPVAWERVAVRPGEGSL